MTATGSAPTAERSPGWQGTTVLVAILACAVVIAAITGAVLLRPSALALPPVNGVLDYQLGGAYPPDDAVTVVSRDRTDEPASGRYTLCYLNAFQTQPGEADWWRESHPQLLLQGPDGPIADPGWPDEYLLDTSTAENRRDIAQIVGDWMDDCATRGFSAVEADNLDSYLRSDGRLTPADNLALGTLLADRAHAAGLALGQKNAPELSGSAKAAGFDFAVAEECQVYDECGAYLAEYGNLVYEIEYTDNGADAFPEACAAQGESISVLLRDRDVVPRGDDGYVSESC